GKELPIKIKGHAGAVTSLAFNRDGNWLASASKDRTVKIWDVITGMEVRTLKSSSKEDAADVSGVSFSPDGARIAWADRNGMVRIFDAAKGDELRIIQAHTDGATFVTYSPTGGIIASAGQDGKIVLWDADKGELPLLTCKGHGAGIMGISFSRDGNRIASASKDGTVKLWDARSGQELQTFRGHDDLVTSVSFSPDGTRVASASLDKTLKVWNAATAEDLKVFKGQHTKAVAAVAYSSDGTNLYSRDETGRVAVWNAQTQTLTQLKDIKAADFGATRASLSPDRKKIAVPFANWFYVVDLQVTKPVAEYRESMSRIKPWWHAERAEQFDKDKKPFAAAFHWAVLVRAEPATQKHREHFDKACGQLAAWEVANLRRVAGLSAEKK
ncbi:MAG TPA: WD40 repeat domain-containing protein, partial [Gemmataceae bacterium]|nr:WD40 repeat domain-containing protein [Gemmataceae bacterium]